MEIKDVLSYIGKAAPIIGSLFGPAGTAIGALAGTGLTVAARALGVEPTQEAVVNAIATDPQASLKLAQYEMEHKIELQKLELRVIELEYADVADARANERARVQATGKPDYNLYALAWLIVIGFFVLMGLMFKYTVPEDQNGVVFMLFGALSTGFGQVLQYFFGSSKSSTEKTVQMGIMRKQIGK